MPQQQQNSTTRNMPVGNYSSHLINGQEIVFTADNAQIIATVYSAGIIRFRIAKTGFNYTGFSYAVVQQPQSIDIDIQEDAYKFIINTEDLHVVITKNPMRISVYNANGELLNEDDKAFGTSWLGNEVTTYKKLQENERFIGLGEKTGNLDRRGKAYVNWNTDNFAYPTDGDPLYLTAPFYIGINDHLAYGIFFDNSHKTTFNFGCSNNRFSYFQAEDGDMDYYLIYKPSIAEIIEQYTWLTGRIEMPPKWSLGFQQCRYSYYPYPEVLNAARTFREKDIPADVLYLDIHYMEAYKVFTWHNKRFPDPVALMKELKEMGFHVVVILDPGVKVEKGYHTYDDGKAKDMFVKFPDGEEYQGQVWPGWSAFPDFTKEEARIWWGEQMKVLADSGVEGYWNDMNEPAAWGQHMPDLMEFDYEGEGGTHKKSRNVYGMQMARSTFEGGKKLLDGKRPFILTRAGYSGIQRYAAVWTGDNVSTDDHMMCGVRLVNSLGLTGIPFAGNDVGGFAGEASPELFARWIALGAFSPFFRSHSMVNSRDSEPWSFGEEVEDISRNYIKLRYRIMPYLYSLFYESSQTGMAIARSLAINYSHDAKIFDSNYQNQYLFGPAFLVIPALSTTNFHKAYFPEGTWYNAYTDKLEAGKTEKILEYGKEVLPLFVKAGSVILMQNSISNFHNQVPKDTLETHIYLGGESSFQYYEDNGTNYENKEGKFLTRNFNLKANSLQIEAPQGNFTSHFKTVKIYIHGLNASTKSVQVNGESTAVSYEHYRFIEPVSDFDPYHFPPEEPLQISNLAFVEIPLSNNELKLTW